VPSLKDESPTVTVLTTYRNSDGLINRAVRSILANSLQSIEVVVINDGSDYPDPISEEYLNDKRLRYTEIEHRGRAEALNLALSQARGEFVAILDCDDVCSHDRFEKQVRALRNSNAVLCYCNARFVTKKNRYISESDYALKHEEIVDQLLELNPFPHSSVMFRREVVLNIGGYRTNVEKSVDFNLYLDLLVNGGTFVGLKEPLVQIMFDSTTWGRSGFEDLQTKYGLMGLVRYHCLQKYDVDLFSADSWNRFNILFSSWFSNSGISEYHYLNKIFKSFKHGSYDFSTINFMTLIKSAGSLLFRLPDVLEFRKTAKQTIAEEILLKLKLQGIFDA
jgi:glycosyltransferase involved in cell wall biosynthesis